MITTKLSRQYLCMTIVASLVVLFAAPPAHAQAAAALYSNKCAACHGTDGKGDGPAGKYLNPKPTDFASSLKGKTDDWIAKAIKGGGGAVGESPVMPAYTDLSDDQVKELVAYLKHFGS
ncbi:MAG: cytochrome c [Candidatus Binatus sp.]|uniref:c-type cytochrome n=2 Tax=Candidatus Binatus sp. TaxID=2811406 RepID=UPI003C7394FD